MGCVVCISACKEIYPWEEWRIIVKPSRIVLWNLRITPVEGVKVNCKSRIVCLALVIRQLLVSPRKQLTAWWCLFKLNGAASSTQNFAAKMEKVLVTEGGWNILLFFLLNCQTTKSWKHQSITHLVRPKLHLFILNFHHVEILCTHLHLFFFRETDASFQTSYKTSVCSSILCQGSLLNTIRGMIQLKTHRREEFVFFWYL